MGTFGIVTIVILTIIESIFLTSAILLLGAKIAKIETRSYRKALTTCIISIPASTVFFVLFSFVPIIGIIIGLISGFILSAFIMMWIFQTTFMKSLGATVIAWSITIIANCLIVLTFAFPLLISYVNSDYDLSSFISQKIGTNPKYNLKSSTRQLIDKYSNSMTLVNGGKLNIASDKVFLNEEPLHKKEVSSFYIGQFEVSQGEWLEIMGLNNSKNSSSLLNPVEQVNWYSAIIFCNKRSILENLSPCYSINGSTNPSEWGTDPNSWRTIIYNKSATGYRLPTEEEWEFAAQGGIKSNGYAYSGSNDINEVGWTSLNSGYTSHKIGSKKANELGIYDMSGNVWEMVGDDSIDSTTNLTTPGSYHGGIIKGGSFTYYCDNAFRHPGGLENNGLSNIGFRIARSLK